MKEYMSVVATHHGELVNQLNNAARDGFEVLHIFLNNDSQSAPWVAFLARTLGK